MSDDAPIPVLVMPGEGIGPEIVAVATGVLRLVASLARLPVVITEHVVGRFALELTGEWLPTPVREAADAAAASGRGAILYGATADEPIGILRKRYDLFANLRPVRPLDGLASVSPLRPDVLAGTDLLVVRELVSDVYYGRRREGVEAGSPFAAQEMYYRRDEAARIVDVALALARSRRRRLAFVHKANVIPGVFRQWFDALADARRAYPDVEVEDVLVDTMAMRLVMAPAQFDVVVTTNLFGDILSEVGAAVLGSLGLVPSVSLDGRGFALYEPAGGTAPDIAGTGRANPLAAVLSVELMLRHTFCRDDLADAVVRAVEDALVEHRTPDIVEPGRPSCSTNEMGAAICGRLEELLAHVPAVQGGAHG